MGDPPVPAAWKTVPVFISSTFRDMHAERDHLVKVVFPALREKLEKYRIHLVDIDLRWGVTADQADNDMALDLCPQPDRRMQAAVHRDPGRTLRLGARRIPRRGRLQVRLDPASDGKEHH